jgi:uncharacterized ferritin-like protein (DUF455 family)
MASDFFKRVRQCFIAVDVDEKLKCTHALAAEVRREATYIQQSLAYFGDALSSQSNGYPNKPELVSATGVPKRGFGTEAGRAIMIHAIAHIEFNAINLALDAVQRFANMPEDYYKDWLRIADEEAYHFELIRAHLRFLGADYGDYPAHQGLWEMAEKTAHDVLERMALVPRVLEARGLDVTPEIQHKLKQAGDHHAATILDIIFADEIGHVEIGTRWFHYLCQKQGKKPDETFFKLLHKHFPKGIYGPYNMQARAQAGFSEHELDILGKGKLKK